MGWIEMLQSLEPVMLLSSVPGELVVAVVTPVGAAFVAMGKAIHVLYVNGRTDGIASITATTAATHAIAQLTASNDKQAAAIEKLAAMVQEDRYKRAAGG
jgi:hypothetical protein